ncbi:hypothetical protein MBLNU459_g5232t1 [Dothideomycetes sp. NU459]
MAYSTRTKWSRLLLLVSLFAVILYVHRERNSPDGYGNIWTTVNRPSFRTGPAVHVDWGKLPVRYPVSSLTPLPTGQPRKLAQVQHDFPSESSADSAIRLTRQTAVREAFDRCWTSYKTHAWMADELAPISGGQKNHFGGWAATLVDSLDTLWIMGLNDDFKEAVAAAVSIDFGASSLDEVNVFETTIRYLGGFLAAYDLSGDQRLKAKAVELGEMLLVAFDTPNRMPITRWNVREARKLQAQTAHPVSLLAEMGSLAMEFTRLSQITGDARWYDATHRVMKVFDDQQNATNIPGMWPVLVNAQTMNFTWHNTFTLGAMSDSLYEYLPKLYALLGGLEPMYEKMYLDSMAASIRYTLWRPMTPDKADILIAGTAYMDEDHKGALEFTGQHLVCFAGGMFALGGKLFSQPKHVDIGRQLTDGCIWTYKALPLGVMPEVFTMLECPTNDLCEWDEKFWRKEVLKRNGRGEGESTPEELIAEQRLPPAFTTIPDRRYILRPEAIESVFVLYRITGRKDLLETAWEMFTAIQENTKTQLANGALADITRKDGKKTVTDSMESFWLAETLKYFYLIFSEPDLISLDEYVFNTEAHPFRRPR